jgi:gas vesicle protein
MRCPFLVLLTEPKESREQRAEDIKKRAEDIKQRAEDIKKTATSNER